MLVRRLLVAAGAAVAFLALTAGAARADAEDAVPAAGCAAFGHVQTYRGWGPALHFERPVTVTYSIVDCRAGVDGDTFTLSLSGTAVVRDAATGRLLGPRPFAASGSWTDPSGVGYPPDWWSCDVRQASFRWEIPNAYSFVVSARDGSWTLDVGVPGAKGVHWDYSAC